MATHLVLVLDVATVFKKPGPVVSTRTRMKFCNIVLKVNSHRLTESHSWFDVKISRWRPWRHFR